MADCTLNLECTGCGASFLVELRSMRVNLRNACPACGFRQSISEDEAIKAHRLLEELELEGGMPHVA
jgi:DNA-directed RNA polymerase subunit RPC12/RpoP